MKKLSFFTFLMLTAMLFTSCMSTKKVAYFQNKDSIDVSLSRQLYDAKIMPKDILQIRVFTTNPETADPFNLLQGTSAATAQTGGSNSVYSYLVDNDGNIEFPVVGRIHLGGMTKNEAEAYIKGLIKPYMSESENPVVHVRMVNYKYAVLGEVNSPGMFTAANEKINVIEALAQAGDLTLYGERDKIYLIRENSDGQKQYHRLNLNDANIISSPYYYLQQNDIVYVEPNKAKAKSSYFSTSTSMWFTLTSMLMSIATFVLAITK